MKETPLSNCEKASLIACLVDGYRLDGRGFEDIRPIKVHFGKEFGSCSATLGKSRVLAQVSCTVVEPRPSRPNEGKISIQLHLSQMAAPHFETSKCRDLEEQIQQYLDRNIKESRCLDLESLCIMAEESVWQLKLDITILNHDGNLGDICNVAAVCALRHFHRPDVTVEEDGRVTIHTFEEREPIPTCMKKVPICLTYGFFIVEEKCYTIMDPTSLEERIMSGKLVVGLNPHGDITSLIFSGKVCLQKKQIMGCIKKAFIKAKEIAEMVQQVVDNDLATRSQSVNPEGFVKQLCSDETFRTDEIQDRLSGVTCLLPYQQENVDESETRSNDMKEDINDDSEEEFSPESLKKSVPELQKERKQQMSKNTKQKVLKNESSDSEEEEQIILKAKDIL